MADRAESSVLRKGRMAGGYGVEQTSNFCAIPPRMKAVTPQSSHDVSHMVILYAVCSLNGGVRLSAVK